MTQFPKDEFARYVRAMPQSEAQTALIFLVNFLADWREGFCNGPVTSEEFPGLSESQIARLNAQCPECQE